MSNRAPKVLWTPSQSWKNDCNLEHYRNWLLQEKSLKFENYDQIWEWSVDQTRQFWLTIYEYFKVIDHGHYEYVHGDEEMPDTSWFRGSKLNYAEHIFRNKTGNHPAVIYQCEGGESETMSWEELYRQVASLSHFLKSKGVKKGDRVVAFLPNIPQATVGFLATCSIGAVWSSCSPDFGSASVVDRFQQIEPRVLITVTGYRYGGRVFDKSETVIDMVTKLPSLEWVIEIPPDTSGLQVVQNSSSWESVISNVAENLAFEPVAFEHPIWVLYSSGTTGKPKAITHSQGGVLLEHLKYVSFHNDVKAGERFFWYTTTGWMMWNFVQATLLVGATIVLYDGSPGYPNMDVLWRFAEQQKINHFGTSAPFILACLKREMKPSQHFNLSSIRSVSSTGSPLPREGFEWIYEHVKRDVWLCSMSGGTDVCSAFVGGCPTETVFEGEIQRRALGCAMFAFDEEGNRLVNEEGEMVITKPMPSMPVFFWNDPDKIKYRESYFETFPGVWRHGDWLEITDRDTLIIKGRSDATLNRQGIRIGTAEIYQSVEKIPAIKDSLIVNIELENGKHFMPLFVVINEQQELTEYIEKQIALQLKQDYSPRHVPDVVIKVPDIPYTISGKKMEAPVKRILMKKQPEKTANIGAMRNPESLNFFVKFAKTL